MFADFLQFHGAYEVPALNHLWLCPAQLYTQLSVLQASRKVRLNVLGHSAEGRPIHHLRIGTGKFRVLMWTQMHGNEATATKAVLDMVNLLAQPREKEAAWVSEVLANCEIHIIPMLNPDGAEVFIRRNAQGIDLNRDFLAETTPETQVFKRFLANQAPFHLALNLHDQNPTYAAGEGGLPSALAFLAPPAEETRKYSPTRKRASALLGGLAQALAAHLPEHLARYQDDFEGRAYGDQVQALGIPTLLLEAGALPKDPHKQKLRKFYFASLLWLLQHAPNEVFLQEKTPSFFASYEALPENKNGRIAHWILRNASFRGAKADLAIVRQGRVAQGRFFWEDSVLDFGQLPHLCGMQEIEAKGKALNLREIPDEGTVLRRKWVK